MGILDKFKNNQPAKGKTDARSRKNAVAKDKDLTLAELQEAKEKNVSENATVVKSKKLNENTGQAYRVLLKPLITEKGTYLAEHNKYLFEVYNYTNKQEIKKAVKAVYGVMPIKVNIINSAGKKVRHGKTNGVTRDKKKAIVTLPKGKNIEVYEGV